MAKLARLTVEKESKIQDAIVLEDKELIIDCVSLPILMMCLFCRRSFAYGFE